jgi:hypothetical protein
MLVDLAEGDGEEPIELIEERGLAGDQASDIGLPGHAYPYRTVAVCAPISSCHRAIRARGGRSCRRWTLDVA